MTGVDVRSTFEALEPLDLKKCNTVGQLVRAMGKCSFVARMIGEVAETLYRWACSGEKAYMIAASSSLRNMCRRVLPFRMAELKDIGFSVDPKQGKVLSLGRFSEGEDWFFRELEQVVFIKGKVQFLNLLITTNA